MTELSKDTAPETAATPKPHGDPQASSEPSVGADANRGVDSTAESQRPPETGGPKGPEPTRYGDWEKGGRCIDF